MEPNRPASSFLLLTIVFERLSCEARAVWWPRYFGTATTFDARRDRLAATMQLGSDAPSHLRSAATFSRSFVLISNCRRSEG
jgi:hypothetical protein